MTSQRRSEKVTLRIRQHGPRRVGCSTVSGKAAQMARTLASMGAGTSTNSRLAAMVDQRRELLRGLDAVAVRDQLGDFVPVGVVVDEHADDPAAPARLEERMPRVDEGVELRRRGAEDEHALLLVP